MATELESQALAVKYGEPIRQEVVPCETTQCNFPHPKNQPWAKDGRCVICGQEVTMIRVGEDNPHLYSQISEPHTRILRTYAVDADELQNFLEVVETW